MPENEASAETTSRTAEEWETEYKKLQRKLTRSQSRNSDNTAQIAKLEAGQSRIEQIVERLIDGDDDADFRQSLKEQRVSDTTAARLSAEVETLLEDKDLNFQTDPRLSEARRLYDEINRTGNLALVDQMKQAITGVDDESSEDTSSTEQERIDAAVATDRKERARVDGGSTTAPNPQSVSRSDLRNMDLGQQSIADIKELTKKAMDQLIG